MSEINYQKVLLLDDNENGLIPFIPPATSNSLGIVKPDNSSTIVTNQGTIQVINMANSALSNLNSTGEAHFANPDLQNLSVLGNSRLQYAPFAMNNGVVNSLGQNITFSTNVAQTSIVCQPCTLTTADGRTFIDTEIRTREVGAAWSNNVDYAVFKNVTTNVLTTNFASRFSISPTAPSSPENNAYWLDTSTIPTDFKIYDGTDWSINNNLVWIGNFVKTDSIVTTIKNRKFNDSGYLVDRHIAGVVETYVNGTSWYRVYSDGWCEQGGVKTGASGQTITLMKSYVNSNYHISGSMLGASYSTIVAFNIIDNSSFVVYTASGGYGYDSTSSWLTCGYLA